jgi:hypothetical protein
MTYFSFTDSGDAYDACQCNEDLTTGTVLKVRDDSYYGRVTGRDEDGFRVREFSEPISVTIIGLAWAWPIAVTIEAGEFHGIEEDTGAYARVIADAGFTREQIAEAVAIADSLSAPVRPMFRMWLAAQAEAEADRLEADTDFDFGDDMATPAAEMRSNAHIANGGERGGGSDAVACPKCGGAGRVQWGECFRCKGSGRVGKRSAAASKARATRDANEEDTKRSQARLVARLEEVQEWNGYAQSLLAKVDTYGTLKSWDVEKATAMLDKLDAGKAERAAGKAEARVAAAPAIDNIGAIVALFDKAGQRIAKRPIFRTTEITISKAPDAGKNPGALYVKRTSDKAYCGKIVGGRFLAGHGAPDVTEALRAVAVDPTGEAIRYANEFKACCCCGTVLRNPVSVAAVVGPICASNWGLEHLRMAAAEMLQDERDMDARINDANLVATIMNPSGEA